MSIETHVESLHLKHAEIDTIIAQEELRPIPDTIRLMHLKKRKLRIKEEMQRFVVTH